MGMATIGQLGWGHLGSQVILVLLVPPAHNNPGVALPQDTQILLQRASGTALMGSQKRDNHPSSCSHVLVYIKRWVPG